MEKINLEDCWYEINCLLPVYTEEGANCTRVILASLDNYKYTDKRTIKSVIRALARTFAVDLEALRKKYGPLVNRKKSIPLPLHPELILVPVRTRRPQWKDHGAWGYLALDRIIGLKEGTEGKETEVVFGNNYRVTVLQSLQSVKSILNDAQIVKTVYRNQLERRNSGRELRECAYHHYRTGKDKKDMLY